jgi:cob(I)alamin adenosyltransferase
MLKLKDVLELMKDKPEHIELVLTGRRAPKKIMEAADLVTEMKLKKHYFYKGIAARQGIEY